MKRYLLAILTTVVTIIAMFGAFYQQVRTRDLAMMSREAIYVSEIRSKELQLKIQDLLEQSVASLPTKATDAAIEVKLGKLDDKIEAVDQKTLALRQAINPLKPDEILTIARLTDEVKELRNDFVDLKKSLSAQQTGFEKSILRETKSSADASRWLFVVLIPLLVNFFYTVWRDFRSERKDKVTGEQQDLKDNKSPTEKPRQTEPQQVNPADAKKRAAD